MSDTLASTPNRSMNRRTFLRGSSLAAAALLGASALPAFAQNPPAGNSTTEEEKKKKPSEGEDKAQDPTKVTKKDDQGREYRICPQCGYNMYRQERTWTCENCGYSYVE